MSQSITKPISLDCELLLLQNESEDDVLQCSPALVPDWFSCPVRQPSQMKKVRSLLVAGAADYDCFYQHLRLLDGAFKLSAKDLRSQVVREACITVA